MRSPHRSVAVLINAAVILALAGIARAGEYDDPVPHHLITEPYRVCQDLEELTARINNLHRKPFDKLIDPQTGVMQPETVYFRDTVSGHEVAALTRELCVDIAHPDLGRPVWTCDGRLILFQGNRGFLNEHGKLVKENWTGRKYIMYADYTRQRPFMVQYQPPLQTGSGIVIRAAGMPGKFNIMHPLDPSLAYYAGNDKLWRVRLSEDADSTAELLCTFPYDRPKIIQDISRDGKWLLIQDANTRPDKDGRLPYMPEIYLVNLHKQPDEAGFLDHHPLDYGLPDVTDANDKVLHAAGNNHWVHSLKFGKLPDTIEWNYGPMTSVGEPLHWTLDIRDGLGGTPTHGDVNAGGSVNRWGQYESHGQMIASSTIGLYFSGPPKGPDGKPLPGGPWGWGIYIRDYARGDQPPRFLMTGPGGHIAGGNCANPNVWAAHMSAAWRAKVKESDAIVWGRIDGPARVLCYTHSDVRGGIRREGGKPVGWTGMDDNSARPYHAIPRPLLSPDGTKVWFHSSMLQPTEDYTGIYVAVIDRPEPPRNLRLAPDTAGVHLRWGRAANARETKGYHVYRREGDEGAFVELTAEAIAETRFEDPTATPGKIYSYIVTAEEWSTLESNRTSSVLRVAVTNQGVTAQLQPGISRWDTTPPPPVSSFTVAREADGQFRLSWERNLASDLRYYNVYFSSSGPPEISQKRRIVSPAAAMTQYLDWSAPADTDACYAITAVDRQGNESAPAHAQVVRQP